MPGPFEKECIHVSIRRACVSISLGHGHTGFQASDAVVTESREDEFAAIEGQRHEKIEIAINDAEATRHYADNLARLCVDLDAAADHARISAEAPLPVAIAQHDGLRAVGVLVDCGEPAPDSRRDGERLQDAVADQQCLRLLGLCDARDVRRVWHPHSERLERVVVLGEGDVHGWGKVKALFEIREPRSSGRTHPQRDELVRLWVGKRLEKYRIDHAEDGGVGADADGEGEQDGDGESGGFAETAKSELEIGEERFKRAPLPLFAAALLD